MTLQRLLPRFRYLVLVLPVLAIGSTVQVGCNGRLVDEYANEDESNEARYGGRNGNPTIYGGYGSSGYGSSGYGSSGYGSSGYGSSGYGYGGSSGYGGYGGSSGYGGSGGYGGSSGYGGYGGYGYGYGP